MPESEETRISFLSDGVSIRGPKQDGTGSVTFEVGEYQLANIAALLALGKNYVLNVSVGVGEEIPHIGKGKKKPNVTGEEENANDNESGDSESTTSFE